MDKYVSLESVLRILRRKCSRGYRDIDGDYVEGSIDKSAIDEIENLPYKETPYGINEKESIKYTFESIYPDIETMNIIEHKLKARETG